MARAEGPGGDLPGEKIEVMAEMDHECWTWSKLRSGFRYDPVSPRKPDTNKCLLAWNGMSEAERRLRYGDFAGAVNLTTLPEEQKNKDRLLVREIPHILRAVGLQAIPIPETK